MFLNFLAWLLWLGIGILVALVARLLGRTRGWHWYEMLVSILGAFLGAFIVNQFGIAGITDFHPWGLIGAPIGAIVLISLYRGRGYPELYPVPVLDKPEVDAEPDIEEIYSETPELLVREPLHLNRDVLVALILLIPLLDIFILRIRVPDISQSPPQFGAIERYSNEYGQLDYLVYAPASADATEMPLLLMLHGCAQDPYILNTASGMKELADANRFVLVYPQQNANASPHRCWNWYQERNQMRDSGEPSLLMGIVNQVSAAYPVDSSRIYVTGISSGGAMTSILASCYPDVFAAAAIHSGMAYKSANSAIEAIIAPFAGNQMHPDMAGQAAYACSGTENQTIPVLDLHGRVDNVVFPVNAGDTIDAFAQMNDYQDDGQDNDSILAQPTNTQSQQVEGGYAYSIEDYVYAEELLMQAYRIDGLGHMWSGGTGIYPLSDPKAPNASQIIWDFFSAYSLP